MLKEDNPDNPGRAGATNNRNEAVQQPLRNRLRIKAALSRNPFINFLRDYRISVKSKKYLSKDVMRMAGEKWRQMSDKEREPYRQMANLIQTRRKRNFYSTRKTLKREKECSKVGNTQSQQKSSQSVLNSKSGPKESSNERSREKQQRQISKVSSTMNNELYCTCTDQTSSASDSSTSSEAYCTCQQ